jgi:arylsulfatase A-like enzyme
MTSPGPSALRVAVAVFLGTLAAASACSPGAPPPPNVLLVVMDTTRADRCSLAGYSRRTTPRLDEFAAESVVFTETWSPASWTYPAHAALFTGLMPEAAGTLVPDLRPISAQVTTLAEHLSRAGWETACFTNNAWIADATRLTRGFDDVEAFYLAAAGPSARTAHDRALGWMRERKRSGKPFFTFVNDVEPHAPWTPEERFQRLFVSDGVPAATLAAARALTAPRTLAVSIGYEKEPPEVLATIQDLYDAEIAGLDAEIGRLLDAMRAEGLLENTMVVVTSDHGEGLGEHGWLEHGAFLHRELLRVPLLVRYPDRASAGTRVTDLVRLHDVFPTVLETCGLPVPSGLDGRTLRGQVGGRIAQAVERPLAAWTEMVAVNSTQEIADRLGSRKRSVFDGRYHLLVDARGGVELYDVASDPAERTNLAPSDPDTVRRLTALLP